MLKKVIILGFLALMVAVTAQAAPLIDSADQVYNLGGTENYRQSIDLYTKACEALPESYEAHWKCARALRMYAEYTKRDAAPNWKEVCKEYGKKGMIYAEKAMQLNPEGVEAPYFYSLSVGNYKDGAGIVTAIKEGLKDKTESGFSNAYQKDKMYRDGGPIKALGRFYSVLPWPLKDNKKALGYLREYQQLFPDDTEGQVYLAVVLIDMKKKDEARQVLNKAVTTDDPYFKKWAGQLLNEL